MKDAYSSNPVGVYFGESGKTVADVVLQEKLREDEIRALGPVVVRWTWSMLEDGSFIGLLRPWLEKFELTS